MTDPEPLTPAQQLTRQLAVITSHRLNEPTPDLTLDTPPLTDTDVEMARELGF